MLCEENYQGELLCSSKNACLECSIIQVRMDWEEEEKGR